MIKLDCIINMIKHVSFPRPNATSIKHRTESFENEKCSITVTALLECNYYKFSCSYIILMKDKQFLYVNNFSLSVNEG